MFLKGETTWAELVDKLIDLATGAVADDVGNTVPVDDRWRRPLAGVPHLVAPASTDVQITQEHRAGYWLRIDDAVMFADKTDLANQFVRQTAVWSAWHSGFREALICTMQVTTPNTVAGDYSNAVVRIKANSHDGSAGTAITGGVLVTLNAAGVGTWTYASGYTMSFALGDPSGFLAGNAFYYRVFTNKWRGGIDTWRGYGKATAVATFGTPLAGVEGVDWDETLDYCPPPGNTLQTSANYWETTATGVAWMDAGWGVGYRTNTALNGAPYEVTFSKNECQIQVFTSTVNYLFLRWGGTGLDAAGTTRRYGREGSTGSAGNSFLRPFTGTPVGTSRIQYWLSVKDGHLAVALNGDSAKAGVTTHNLLAKVEVDDPDNDNGCWMKGAVANFRAWQRLGPHYLIERLSAKGLRDGGRDWQTGYGRMDFHPFDASEWANGECGYTWTTSDISDNRMMTPDSNASEVWPLPQTIDRTVLPNLVDPRWPLLGWSLADEVTRTTESSSRITGLYRPRGYVGRGLWMTPRGGFADGDELVDTDTGDRYMLFLANAQSALGTINTALVLEEA